MKYSENKIQFSKTLLSDLSPLEDDYAFFVSDLLDSIEHKFKINILPHSPFDSGFTDIIKDVILIDNVLELFFETSESYKIVLSRQEIKQVSPVKYYVNCEKENQVINITFIK